MSAETDRCRGRLELFLRRELASWDGAAGGVHRAGCRAVAAAAYPARGSRTLAAKGLSTGIAWRRWPASPNRCSCTSATRFFASFGPGYGPSTGPRANDWCRTSAIRRTDSIWDLGWEWSAGGEWVYAARGLMLGVISDTGLIARVACYRPCSVATYRRCLHHAEPAREFPGLRER